MLWPRRTTTARCPARQFIANNPNGGPGTPEALYLQGRVSEHRAETADVAGHQAEAHSICRTRAATYEHALTLSPSPKIAALLHAGVANVAYFQEDYFTAMREWAAAYPGLTQPDAKAWVKYRLGLCQQRLGRFDEADRSFAEVRQDYPHSEPAQRAAAHQGVKGFYVVLGSWADPKAADTSRRRPCERRDSPPSSRSCPTDGIRFASARPTTMTRPRPCGHGSYAAYPAATIEP